MGPVTEHRGTSSEDVGSTVRKENLSIGATAKVENHVPSPQPFVVLKRGVCEVYWQHISLRVHTVSLQGIEETDHKSLLLGNLQ